MNGALSGYRVLDLTDEKGMFCARMLADMGAEVVRIENPHEASQSATYCYQNLGKRSITLNLKTSTGQEIFKRLAQHADAVIESYQPGYLSSLGLNYTELNLVNPRLIMASITGFGQSGPYRNYKSSDLIISALSGRMSVCGDAESPPLKPFGSQAYYTASLFAAIGVLLAIRERHDSGKGQYIGISALECAVATLDHVMVRYFYTGEVARRQGSLHWNNGFRIFPCKDGYILLSLFQQWDTLVELLAAEGAAEDLTEARWRDGSERNKHLEHVIEVLERWTKRHEVGELVELGQLMHFPWAKVTGVSEILASPQFRERHYFTRVECGSRPGLCPGAAVKMSGSPWRVGQRIPEKGEDNEEVYKILGLSSAEVASLKENGTI
ncbi:MAG: CaiB/BaiF CoA-transferase family protein [Dehalococcoidales bacterium]|nr:CaiB/BaiF CoA-transferase family protein [Dehalococcoidales bacterium]